ncbi:MAG: DUF998 domain-containing protein [Promethearchaeota archaeon]
MANIRDILSPRVAAFCGVVGPLIGFASIALAVTVSASWFNWFSNALSDLGHPYMLGGLHGVPGFNPAALIFNAGMFITGIITLLPGFQLVRVQRTEKSIIGTLGGLLFIASMIFLSGVGICNESAELLLLHIITAGGFFISLMLASILYGVALLRFVGTRREGLLALFLSIVITVTFFFGFRLIPGAAIPEMIIAVAGFLWLLPICFRLYHYAGKMGSLGPAW